MINQPAQELHILTPIKRVMGAISILLLSIIVAACEKEKDTGATHTFQSTQHDNIILTNSTGGPKYRGELFRYEEVLRFSEFQSAHESFFIDPSTRLVADRSGNIYIADNGNSVLYKFDLSGQLLMTVGGEGEGPGEFRGISIVDVSDERIVASDFYLQRATVFSSEGDMLGIYHAPSHRGRLQSINVIKDGILLCAFLDIIQDGEYQYFSRSIVVAETPQQIRAEVSVGPVKTTYNYPGGAASIPFGGRPMLVYSPIHGILATTGEEPTIQVYNLNGTHTRTLNVELPKQVITSEMKSRYQRAIRRVLESAPAAPSTEQIQDMIEYIQYPSHKAHWSDLQVDGTGLIWLCIPAEEPDPFSSRSEYRILSSQGEYLGITQWPLAGGFVSNGFMLSWDQSTEAEEGYTVLVYRIIPIVEGLEYP